MRAYCPYRLSPVSTYLSTLVKDHPYTTSAKGLGGWVQKMANFTDVEYCIYAYIVGGSEKVTKMFFGIFLNAGAADVI